MDKNDVALQIFVALVGRDQIFNKVAVELSFELAELFLIKCNATSVTSVT